MNFFNSKIVTKTISLEDAVKKSPKPVRSLDEIIASAKQMKTAGTQAEVKTASVQAPETPKVEAPKTEVKAEVKPTIVVKVATEMTAVAAKTEAPKAQAPAAPVKAEKTAAPGKHVVKLASELDFRNWEAQTVVDAWKQHGSVQQCVANVAGKASDGKAYCELLRVAASEATNVIKTAAAKKETKTAAPIYKKIAKLTSQEQSFLRDFFKKIYGEEYVTALLGDY